MINNSNNSNKLLSRHSKHLFGWLGGFLVGVVFVSSAVALENLSMTNKIATPIEAVNPVVEPVKKVIPPKKTKRKIAAVAVATTAAAATLVDNKAVVVAKVDDKKVVDNLTPKMVDGRLLAPDIARIVTRGELIVAVLGEDRPPFLFQRAGVFVGLEADIVNEIANALKVKVKFERSATTFNQVVDVVAHQKADLGISKLSRTLARSQMVRFSIPYLTLDHALLLNRLAFSRMVGDKSVQQVIRNFNGTIGVIEKSSFDDFAAINFPKAEIRTYSSWPEVINAVSNGEIMSAYRDEFEIKQTLKKNPNFSLKLRSITLKDVESTVGIVVGISDPTLLAFINQLLEQRSNKLDIKKLLEYKDN